MAANIPQKTNSTGRRLVIFLQTGVWWLSKFWAPVAIFLAGAVLALALLAPTFMSEGYTGAGQTIYGWLAPHDHQLPQRSYFLFAPDGLVHGYSLEQVLAWGADPDNLRAFVGNPDIGYKMGLNHRMTAIFVGIFFGGLFWVLAGERPKVGPFLFILMMMPLLVDGFSHRASETNMGYRNANQWAVALTGGVFGPDFYPGTTIGTLNWWLRTLTGLLFGLGLVWFLFTYFAIRFAAVRRQLEPKLRRAGVLK